MNIIYAQTRLNLNANESIFLAGPTPRDKDTKSWRPEAIECLLKFGYEGNVYIPEMEYGWDNNFEYTAQIEWEDKALNKATVIVFWIPRELNSMPAFTTNIEWGRWTERDPNKLVLGYPVDAVKMNYLEYYAKKLNIPVRYSLPQTIRAALEKTREFYY